MFRINTETTQDELIKELLKQLKKVGNLYIEVDSLPYFLSSHTSIKVFKYKISNYPRTIFWNSDDDRITDFLRQCDLKVAKKPIHKKQENTVNSENKIQIDSSKTINKPTILNISSAREKVIKNQGITQTDSQNTGSLSGNPTGNAKSTVSINLKKSIVNTRDRNLETTNRHSSTISLNRSDYQNYKKQVIESQDKKEELEEKINSTTKPSYKTVSASRATEIKTSKPVFTPVTNFDKSNIQNYNAQSEKKEVFTEDVVENINKIIALEKEVEERKSKVASNHKPLNQSTFKNNNEYEPSVLLDSLKEKLREEQRIEKYDFVANQNLDDWLESIEKTKEAVYKRSQKDEVKKKKTIFQNRFIKIISNRWVINTLASIAVLSVGFGASYIYPRYIWAIQANAEKKETALDISFPKDLVEVTNKEFSSELEVPTSGQKLVPTETNRSTGKVSLLNNSSQEIKFDKNGIILISESNGLEYRHKSNESDPFTFKIPGKNSEIGQTVEIEIQAVGAGEDYNLPDNSLFKVYNLQGERLGISFAAVAVSDIKDTQVSSSTVVSEADNSLLQSQARSQFIEDKASFLETLKSRGYYTSPAWYNIISQKDDFGSNVGEITENQTLTSTYSVDLYTIHQDKLKEVAKKELSASTLDNVNLVDTSLGENDSQFINAKVFVTYTSSPNINETELTKNLDIADMEKAKSFIQNNYPNIQEVSVEKKGLSLPGFSPINDVQVEYK